MSSKSICASSVSCFFAYIWAFILRTVMTIKLTLFLILISASIFGQEIGHVKNGKHTVKLIKSENLFSWVYSDVTSKIADLEKSFNFPNKETIFNMIIEG